MTLPPGDIWQKIDIDFARDQGISSFAPLKPLPVNEPLGQDYALSFVQSRDLPIGGFAAGTRIITERGELPVEHLTLTDRVQTIDHGLQPIRWINRRVVQAEGDLAPVEFQPGAVGNSRRLRLSGKQHILVSGWRVELLFASDAALIKSAHLVNGDTIKRVPVAEIEYTDILCDRHEIIVVDGCRSETFFPTERNLTLLDPAARKQLGEQFPELDWCIDTYGASARHCLTAREAMLLLS